MFTEMDRYFVHRRREELAREAAAERLGRRLRSGQLPFRSHRQVAKPDAGPVGGGLRSGVPRPIDDYDDAEPVIEPFRANFDRVQRQRV